MPEGGDKLPAEQIAAISRWIDLGAPYDQPLVENPRDPDSWTAKVVDAKAREFWSFQPLANHQPPAVKNAAWPRGDIDRFVLAKLEEKGLTPNAPAERRVRSTCSPPAASEAREVIEPCSNISCVYRSATARCRTDGIRTRTPEGD